jgi:hypothetical protein
MPSAIATPTFAAQNASILNDGSADSPRGFGNVTTTGTFNITATGPSLYRVVVATPAAPITAALPTTVKAGYRCRIEVELTGSTETNCFFTSPAIAEAQINGTGFVELMALVDNPSVAGNWKVTDVEETVTQTLTATGANNNNVTASFFRRKKHVSCDLSQTLLSTLGGSAITTSAIIARMRPDTVKSPGGYINSATNVNAGAYAVATSGAITGYKFDGSPFTLTCGLNTSISWFK